MPFNAQDKAILERLTGRVPIFLNAIVSIQPEHLSEASDGDGFETTDGLSGDEYKQKAQHFYHLLYKRPEVKDLAKRIFLYGEKQSMVLRDTDELLL